MDVKISGLKNNEERCEQGSSSSSLYPPDPPKNAFWLQREKY